MAWRQCSDEDLFASDLTVTFAVKGDKKQQPAAEPGGLAKEPEAAGRGEVFHAVSVGVGRHGRQRQSRPLKEADLVAKSGGRRAPSSAEPPTAAEALGGMGSSSDPRSCGTCQRRPSARSFALLGHRTCAPSSPSS